MIAKLEANALRWLPKEVVVASLSKLTSHRSLSVDHKASDMKGSASEGDWDALEWKELRGHFKQIRASKHQGS